MSAAATVRIKDVFYETRVLKGRQFTVRRFAQEVLGDAVDPVMLSYIEKGKRFPSEALVRRLAAVRGEGPHTLLALLWRDRMLHAFGKELRRLLQAPRAVEGVTDAELAVRASQAIAALPDDGEWIPLAAWRSEFTAAPRRAARRGAPAEDLAARVEAMLRERKLVEVKGRRVRRVGRHYTPRDAGERGALAMEYCALFAKGLVDKLALAETDTGTYLRNHFLNIDGERLPEFQRRLDQALRALAEEFAGEVSPRSRFLNVLVTSTTL